MLPDSEIHSGRFYDVHVMGVVPVAERMIEKFLSKRKRPRYAGVVISGGTASPVLEATLSLRVLLSVPSSLLAVRVTANAPACAGVPVIFVSEISRPAGAPVIIHVGLPIASRSKE